MSVFLLCQLACFSLATASIAALMDGAHAVSVRRIDMVLVSDWG